MLFFSHSGYKYSTKRCESIVTWFVDKYLPRHKIFVNVDHKGLLKEGVFGWQWSTDSDSRPREFEIEIHNRLSVEEYTKTLLHELWHVLQHVRGDLRDKRNQRLWKGIDHSLTLYSDQPWELEALRMEEVLFREYTEGLTKF